MADFDEIRTNLQRKGAWRDCPACGTSAWVVANEIGLVQALGEDQNQITFGRGWRAIPLFCTNCGFVRHHVLDYLGLKPKSEAESEGSPDKKQDGSSETG